MIAECIVLGLYLFVHTVNCQTKSLKDMHFRQMDISEHRILGGNPATMEEFPFLVTVQYDEGYFCAGSIFNRETVVTAAHCVKGTVGGGGKLEDKWGTYFVRAGVTDWFQSDKPVQVVKVADVKYNPDFDEIYYTSDVAVLILEEPLNYTDLIKPVQFATKAEVKGVAHSTTMGWGLGSYNASATTRLLKVDVADYDMDQCRPYYSDLDKVDETQFVCAGDHGFESCSGDSGGPIVSKFGECINYKQAGLVSFTGDCATHPALFTDVGFFNDWITKNAKGAPDGECELPPKDCWPMMSC